MAYIHKLGDALSRNLQSRRPILLSLFVKTNIVAFHLID